MSTESEEEVRVCHICRDVLPEDEDAWVRPCRCLGSAASVHHDCLLDWVQALEDLDPARTVRCAFCLAPYKILPRKGPLVSSLEFISGRLYPRFCLEAGILFCVLAVEATTTTFGLLTLSHIYGRQEAKDLVLSGDFVEAVITCQFVAFGLVALNCIPVEDLLLRVLRRASRLPILRSFLPKEDKKVRDRINRVSPVQATVGGLLLPFYAKMAGEFLFSSTESKLGRVLRGGLFFLFFKYVLTMFYKQKLYVRQSTLTIANYSNPHSQH